MDDEFVPFMVVLDVTTVAVAENTLEVDPNRNGDHVEETYDCSVEFHHHIHVNVQHVNDKT